MEQNVKETNTENISFISKSEQFIEKNQKAIIACIIAIVVIVLAIFGIKKFVSEPRQQKANEAVFAAEQFFAQGDFQAALYGDTTTNDKYSVARLRRDDEGRRRSGAWQQRRCHQALQQGRFNGREPHHRPLRSLQSRHRLPDERRQQQGC